MIAGPVLVTGAGGLLGGLVAWTFAQRGVDVYAFNHAQLDVTDADAVRRAIGNANPAIVVHCAAMTNVDACELDPQRAFDVNARGSENIALAAVEVAAKVVAVSTDYVFNGRGGPYRESDPTDPIQVYGRSKLEGENLVKAANPFHQIVRSAWIYGPGGKNFLSKLPELARTKESITAVADQVGSPTYAPDLAQAIFELGSKETYGTFHVVNAGECTFAEFCEAGVEILGSPLKVAHVSVADLDLPAPRPRDSRLSTETWEAAGFPPLRPWREAARSFLTEPLS